MPKKAAIPNLTIFVSLKSKTEKHGKREKQNEEMYFL